MIVEEVRSCYTGTWRLFKDRPDITTRGRYVFAPEGTGYFEDFHYFGSEIWTHDVYIPQTDPPLGEIAIENRSYSSGLLGVPYPLGGSLGSNDCFSGGEIYPPTLDRHLVAGLDCRCWTSAGQPCPDNIPLLWLRPQSIDSLDDGSKVSRWKDSSVYANHVFNADTRFEPIKDTLGVFAGVARFPSWELLLKNRFRVGGEFCCFVVSKFIPQTSDPRESASLFLFGGLNSWILKLTRHTYGYQEIHGGVSHTSVIDTSLGVAIYTVRKKDRLVNVYRNGVAGGPPGSALDVLSSSGGVGQNILPSIFAKTIGLFQLKLFPSALTDVQVVAETTALKLEYGIP